MNFDNENLMFDNFLNAKIGFDHDNLKNSESEFQKSKTIYRNSILIFEICTKNLSCDIKAAYSVTMNIFRNFFFFLNHL